jgi:hypothetical protein
MNTLNTFSCNIGIKVNGNENSLRVSDVACFFQKVVGSLVSHIL